MTCIIGLVEKGKVFIGGDSAGVIGLNYSIREDEKVFKNGEFIFGFTTSFRMGQLLRYKLKIPEQHPNEKNDYKFLVVEFIDSVKQCLKDNDFASCNSDVIEGGTFLIGYRKNLYLIDSDFQVGKVRKSFDSVGCGQNYALGAMEVISKENTTAKERIFKALDVVQQFSAGVREPFNIVSI